MNHKMNHNKGTNSDLSLRYSAAINWRLLVYSTWLSRSVIWTHSRNWQTAFRPM